MCVIIFFFFFSSRRRHTRWNCDWSSDVCSSDLLGKAAQFGSADWVAPIGHVACEEVGDLPGAFLGVKRAGAIDECAARLNHFGGGGEETLLYEGEARDIVGCSEMEHIGVT